MRPFQLPEGFLLGSSTAATQIEGGDRNNNWYDWYAKGNIRDGSSILRADDHWNRVEEDADLLTVLSQQVYRMGIEWSRIEPEKGKFDAEAMAHYREEITRIVERGVRPLVTLHHFTHPLWLTEEGGFETSKVVEYFERYVRYVVENIGDLVSEYITINEPNVYVVNGYVFGIWPPGKTNFALSAKVYINMVKCHIAAYKIIHEIRAGKLPETMVGVAHHLRVFIPYNRFNPLDHLAAKIMRFYFQDGIVGLMSRGKIAFPFNLLLPRHIRGCYSDFMGINYYSRSAVKFRGMQDGVLPGAPLNDLGWEIYPEGIALLCRKFYKKYGLPIWITENGVCDNSDALRAEFICDHLEQLANIAGQGVRVERYYHWSLLDNFEWLEGESARFGLVHVNYSTQERRIKRSGDFYAQICRSGGVTQKMIDAYENDREKVPAAR